MVENFKGKKILLLYAKFFHYDQIVYRRLKELGAEIDLYDARAELSTSEKTILKIYMGFFHKKLKRYHKDIQERNKNKQYDFIFSNSYLPKETVISYREKFPNARLLLYLDDSVKNTYDVENTFSYYDSVKTFDRSDSLKYKIELRPLYFTNYNSDLSIERNKYDLCFIGTIHSDRLKVISKIEKLCQENNLRFYHYCYLQSHLVYYFFWLTKKEFRSKNKDFFKFDQLDYNRVSEILSSSTAIIDIQHPLQTGLTMRTIETMGAGRKILTTNKDIEKYEIFNPQNVAIVNRDNPKFNVDFFKTPLVALSNELMYKYSLDGWLNSIFFD